jgi:branched-chain amino acid transport system ATP-binding protein
MSVLDNAMVAATGQAGERFWNAWLRPNLVSRQERQTKEAARHWLNFVGLSEWEQKPARILSGGQRKLLELARVMVANPKLVLLDEPGAGVNPVLLDRIVNKVTALNAAGTTFLIIEHNMDLVASLCKPVMVMVYGRLLISGDPKTVLSDPRVMEAYLGNAAA